MTALTDLAALIDKAARLHAAQDPALAAERSRQEQRYQIQAAALAGNPQQQAAMKAARVSGDPELIAIEAALAQARAAAALQAFDDVFGGEGSQDGQGTSGGHAMQREGHIE